MATRTREYLYLYDAFEIVDTEANLGTGKTITAFFSESRKGSASAIASSTKTATGSGGTYTITYSRSDLQTALSAYVNKTVYLHLDDGAAAHEVYEYVVTDTDPDLLPTLT